MRSYWILLVGFIINIAGAMAMGNGGKHQSKCPYDLTIASHMIPSSCFANNTDQSISKSTCCWSAFASYVHSISLYANRTGTVLLDANGSRHCTNEFVRFVRSRGLVDPAFFRRNSTCVINPLTFTANAGPCRYATLDDIWKVSDLGNASMACDGPNLNEQKACVRCQNKVIGNALELLNLTNSKEFVPCGITVTIGIWGRDPSEERYVQYYGCVNQVLGNVGGLGTSSLIPSPPPPPNPPPVSREPSGSKTRRRSRIPVAVLAGSAGGGVVLLVLAVLIVAKFKKRNRPLEDSTASSSLQALTRSLMGRRKRPETVAREPLPTEGLYIFTKRELQRATDDFSEGHVLGKGGSGKVYLGKLPSGKQVAIKRIVQKRKVDQFYQEVELLSRLRHPNLTSLLGYCRHRGEYILVYEYMPGGDLGCLLYRQQNPAIPWDRRLRIALDCAEGLTYLHLFPGGAIVHRDIKPTNILLNESGQAKLSDFGVSKLIAPDFSHASTEIKGTTGYLDPEYFTVGKLTEASDVYSFGIVLLQLISGKKAIINTPSGGAESIAYTTHMFMRGGDPDVRNLVDPRIAEAVDARDLKSIKMLLDVAYRCAQPYRDDRPSMAEILNVVKEAWKNCKDEVSDIVTDTEAILISIADSVPQINDNH